jgi:hypothetical protein
VPRWFFTSRIPQLEQAVADALETEELHRSMILAPDAFGTQPPTDGAFYHLAGVPVMNFLTAPFYLFDEMDTLDKVDRDNLSRSPARRSASSTPPPGSAPPSCAPAWSRRPTPTDPAGGRAYGRAYAVAHERASVEGDGETR